VIKRLVLDERRSWEMQLSNNVIVKLGRENTENRLARFIKVFNLENTLDMKNIESMDLRYPNGFAVRMKTTQIRLRETTLVKEV
jgi:cell division protein FtsQ